MKKITIFSILALCLMVLSFCSCNSDSDTYKYPTTTEAYNMMLQIAGRGYNSGKIYFPGDSIDKNTKWKADSVVTTIHVNPTDSSYTISNFPVSKLSNYIKDETVSKAFAKLPDLTLKGKLLAADAQNLGFGTVTDNISCTMEDGKVATLAFYAGYSNYSIAGPTTDKKRFVIYLTPGAIYIDGKLKSDYVRTYTNYGYAFPYIVRAVYSL